MWKLKLILGNDVMHDVMCALNRKAKQDGKKLEHSRGMSRVKTYKSNPHTMHSVQFTCKKVIAKTVNVYTSLPSPPPCPSLRSSPSHCGEE